MRFAVLRILSFLALVVLPCACGGGSGAAPSPDPVEPPPVGGLACADDLVPALDWFDQEAEVPWTGAVEFGQTHVVREVETRLAPQLVGERAALLLFTPDVAVAPSEDVRVGAFAGEAILGVLPARGPSQLPPPLEAELTSVRLDPYSTSAWSVPLPWSWMRDGVTLRIARATDDTLFVRDVPLESMGAPHRLTVTRTKIVLFGDASFDTTTQPAGRLAGDFFASLPIAELRWVDTLPWVLDACVVLTPDGPRRVTSEAERQAITSRANHYAILKHQVALRSSLANTGRGLAVTVEWHGDSSPYSFGTSVGLGWYVDPAGLYRDIDDAGVAGGWTGWSAIWLGECGNVFIHELGHSFTLLHFTGGTAAAWGIADEYPQDGTNLASHPWGYDTTRHRFRTWYRVDAGGPVEDANGRIGKRDPMNGGEAPNAVTCFPQYTAYHARKIQAWAAATPTIADLDGQPGIYRWNAGGGEYAREAAAANFQEPVAVDVPVVTLVGTLGNTDAASQTYPPQFAASGNVFDLPDPFAAGLPDVYTDAVWFLAIAYVDGTTEYAAIARGTITDTALYLYSLNLDARRSPVRVDLYRSPTGYPVVDLPGAVLVHSRDIVPPAVAPPAVVTVGRGKLANDALTLREPCEPGVNCERRRVESTWRVAAASLHFEDAAGQTPGAAPCLEAGAYSVLDVPIRDEAGRRDTLVVHGQRVVRTGLDAVAVPLHDDTPWFDAPDMSQTLRLWVPHDPNRDLPSGRYRNDGTYLVRGFFDDVPLHETPIVVDFEVLERTPVVLSSEYVGDGLTTPNSSMYFLVRDPNIGPTARVWWGGPGPTRLTVPVRDEATADLTTLVLDAHQEACGARWDFHAGRAAGNCAHHPVLNVAAVGNEHLSSGHTYRTPASAPLVVEGRRWHAPEAAKLIHVYAFEIEYTAP